MSVSYWVGVATLPALLVGGYVASWLTIQGIIMVGHLSLGTMRRFDPNQNRMARERRAAILYGLRRGVVFSKGEFVLIFGHGLDDDRHRWASERLLKRVALADILPSEKRGEDAEDA